ncbi:unnamed protein product, partial [Arabidopsis thaliana]
NFVLKTDNCAFISSADHLDIDS